MERGEVIGADHGARPNAVWPGPPSKRDVTQLFQGLDQVKYFFIELQ